MTTNPKPRGRPRKEQPLTAAERQKAFRQRQKAKAAKALDEDPRVTVALQRAQIEELQRAVAELRSQNAVLNQRLAQANSDLREQEHNLWQWEAWAEEGADPSNMPRRG